MKLLDERGIGTVWSICKEKFALVGHTHNYAGSGSPGGSANSAIGVVDYNQTGKTIQIGYSGTGITGDQIKYIAGYTDGSGNVNAKIKDVSKDALKSWLGLGSLAYSSSSIPTKLSQLNNDKGFVTGSVSGNTVTINGASTTWTNTWRGIQDNLTSSSTSDSLSANQGKVLKGLIDSKADSSDLSSYYAQKSDAIKNISIEKMSGLNTQLFIQTIRANDVMDTFPIYRVDDETDGLMSVEDKVKLDGIASGANNYTLPVASQTTLGGVKTSIQYIPVDNWPTCVNEDNNKIYTSIYGLERGEDTFIRSITIHGDEYSTKYINKGILIDIGTTNTKTINFPSKAGTFALTTDIPATTSQLVNDSGFLTFADKYTLPVASNTTLGGIKVSANASGTGWPICVDSNGLAQTKINGLTQGRSNFVSSLIVADEDDHSVEYKYNGIDVGFSDSVFTHIDFPSKSGTFALLSDIPDVSNLCKFNFIDSISECQNGKINYFLNRDFGSGDIDLKEFENCEEGTILFLSIYSQYQVGITNSQNIWYMDMRSKAVGSIQGINSGAVILITIKSGAIYAFKIS